MKRIIYICAIKVAGFPFAVESKELADEWVERDEQNYYYEVEIKDTVD